MRVMIVGHVLSAVIVRMIDEHPNEAAGHSD
jgi:hypothetical protein